MSMLPLLTSKSSQCKAHAPPQAQAVHGTWGRCWLWTLLQHKISGVFFKLGLSKRTLDMSIHTIPSHTRECNDSAPQIPCHQISPCCCTLESLHRLSQGIKDSLLHKNIRSYQSSCLPNEVASLLLSHAIILLMLPTTWCWAMPSYCSCFLQPDAEPCHHTAHASYNLLLNHAIILLMLPTTWCSSNTDSVSASELYLPLQCAPLLVGTATHHFFSGTPWCHLRGRHTSSIHNPAHEHMHY
jgi:hypothetical protein